MPININIKNSTISVVAKRGSGKSVLLKYIVDQQRHEFAKIFVVCPTETVKKIRLM